MAGSWSLIIRIFSACTNRHYKINTVTAVRCFVHADWLFGWLSWYHRISLTFAGAVYIYFHLLRIFGWKAQRFLLKGKGLACSKCTWPYHWYLGGVPGAVGGLFLSVKQLPRLSTGQTPLAFLSVKSSYLLCLVRVMVVYTVEPPSKFKIGSALQQPRHNPC